MGMGGAGAGQMLVVTFVVREVDWLGKGLGYVVRKLMHTSCTSVVDPTTTLWKYSWQNVNEAHSYKNYTKISTPPPPSKSLSSKISNLYTPSLE